MTVIFIFYLRSEVTTFSAIRILAIKVLFYGIKQSFIFYNLMEIVPFFFQKKIENIHKCQNAVHGQFA